MENRSTIPKLTQAPTPQAAPQKKKGCKSCVIIALIVLAIPVLGVGGFLYTATSKIRQSDADVLKNYTPSAEIADIAEKTGLKEKGKAMLYRGDPTFVNVQDFRTFCERDRNPGEIALACFRSAKANGGPFGGPGIYLLELDDPKYEDHKYAAAVHEMLHLAYFKLPKKEKEELAPILKAELDKKVASGDTHLANIADMMAQKGGDELYNEMHSKFGVEYNDLSPELTAYYQKYFIDKSKVVSLFTNSSHTKNVKRIEELKTEIDEMATKIESTSNQLNAYKSSGQIDKYNSLVPTANSMVSQYNTKVAESKNLYAEVEKFYKFFDPNYVMPVEKEE